MRQWTVDAFASAAFRGNPACVVEPLSAWGEDAWMQALAMENNQAETAFLRRTADPARFDLRWFTPTMEVELCGHATLASAHVLFTELAATAERLTFDTRAGPLIVERAGEGYAMDFPADPPRRTDVPEGLAEALGVAPDEVWAGRYLIAVLKDAAAVRGLTPDIAALHRIAGEATGGRGNIVVAATSDNPAYDVVDRFFAPGSGVAEDPATGSAHCILAPLYADKLDRAEVRFLQAYPGRGGDIVTELRGDRVILKGRGVTTVDSRLRV
ncbi:MAG: PhzF family phenazine biosynthesis protein [Brevundimonas sp.]